MAFAPYLNFAGTCREAMTFYAKVFGATDLRFMTGADIPPGEMEDWPADLILHAQFSSGEGPALMASDVPRGTPVDKAGASVYFAARDIDAARGIFERLSEGATVQMPFGPTFWSKGFGGLVDRFGTSWMISVVEEGDAA